MQWLVLLQVGTVGVAASRSTVGVVESRNNGTCGCREEQRLVWLQVGALVGVTARRTNG